jgi:ribosomal protein S18 acetylase RimI-like enzyme
MRVRPREPRDDGEIFRVLEPMLRAGETYTLPRAWSEAEALAYWRAPAHRVFVAELDGKVVGTYYLRPNQLGGGAHVANAGYVSDPACTGRGVARTMCMHSLEQARALGFRAMQFNFVVATNERAVLLWQSLGFEIVGRLPGAFEHPRLGFVDALVMFKTL